MNKPTISPILITGLLSVACCLTGCVSITMPAMFAKKLPEANSKRPAVRILSMWQPAEGRGLDNLPTRGFASSLYFFTNSGDIPVKVNGTVRVYLFDDAGTEEERAKPIHQFDFDAQSWNTYLTDTQLGPSYQLFIPYVRKGRHQSHCSLMVRFTPDNGGPVIYSDMCNVDLPGSSKAKTAPPESLAAQAQPALTSSNIPTAVDADSTEEFIRARLQEIASSKAGDVVSAEHNTAQPAQKKLTSTTIPRARASKLDGDVAYGRSREPVVNPVAQATESQFERTAYAAPQPSMPVGAAEDRLSRIESALEQLLNQQSQPPVQEMPPAQGRRTPVWRDDASAEYPADVESLRRAVAAEMQQGDRSLADNERLQDVRNSKRFRLSPAQTAREFATQPTRGDAWATQAADRRVQHPLAADEQDQFPARAQSADHRHDFGTNNARENEAHFGFDDSVSELFERQPAPVSAQRHPLAEGDHPLNGDAGF